MSEKGTKKWLREGYEWLQLLSVLLVVLIGCFAFFFTVAVVAGSSMYPTLEDEDMMLVRRVAYEPENGDVVVLCKEDSFEGRALVKRIIATEGQSVYIDYEANTITVDGEVLDEPYLNYEQNTVYGSDFMFHSASLLDEYANQTFVVPEGCVFVCGDNRNNSADSRSAELGMVDERYIIGEALVVIWPLSHFGSVD